MGPGIGGSSSPQLVNLARFVRYIGHCLRKRARRPLGEIVPNSSGNGSVLIFGQEHFCVTRRIWVRCAVGVAFHGDGRHGDDEALGELLFQIVVFRFAFGETEPRTVVVDHDRDMIRIVECLRAAIERSIVKIPIQGGDLPDQLRES